MNQYNDYELLYLMNEFDEEAERIFFEKYSNLIRNRIYKLNVRESYREDFFQEGLYMLYIASKTYDESQSKTFNKYFDMILQRKFLRLLNNEQYYQFNVELQEDENLLSDNYSFQYDLTDEMYLSDFEEKVLFLKMKNYKPKEISKILDCDTKSIYNCLYRIKNKYDQ